RRIVVDLPRSTLVSPRSAYEPFDPPASRKTEREALQALLRADPSQRNEDFIQFELDDFACYMNSDQSPCEMRGLHDHATRTGKQAFYFDGTLRIGDAAYLVQGVEFDQIPLGNYGKDPDTGCYEPAVGDQMWIRSQLNARREIYYQLKRPAPEYARFHEAFLWVADLAKHMFDFCEHLLEDGRDVCLRNFKEDFGKWLRQVHQGSRSFLKWYSQRKSDDFRQSIIANKPFLRKEMHGTFDRYQLERLHIFREIAEPFDFYKGVGTMRKTNIIPHTIVTPYIYECFSRLRLAGLLKPVKPCISAEEATRLSWGNDRTRRLAFTRTAPASTNRNSLVSGICPGDLISTPPDAEESGTKWMTDRPDKKWYGLVQKVHTTKKGGRRYDVIWLYQPEDTPCCSMKYPWPNELFLSEHCTCDQSVTSKIGEGQVLDVHSVEWFGSPDTEAEFFVRQTYHTAERRFVTLEEAHLQCNHDNEPATEYTIGDTVLASTPNSRFLEPCELLGYLDRNRSVLLRRFRRRREFDVVCAPNELVYTANAEDELHLSVNALATRCIVRCYPPGEPLPAPYNRNGTGNAFFVSHCLLQDGSLQPLGQNNQPHFRQGFDPNQAQKRLRGMDLFCGGGNFGRGLEDGGAVEANWANDISKEAIHTYMANTKEPDSVQPFLGSIDDLLLSGIEGKFSAAVPRPGEVDVISGGSPCPGFSLITSDKTTLHQTKNRSLVASFASCVDFWRPRWGILENVRTIVQSMRNRTEDFFSQLICALVGMGYQCQIILGEAWSYGCPQRRVRAFLYFAAPGVSLPKPPYPSHSTPAFEYRLGSRLGQMTNGEPYVERIDRPTAFEYVTASKATADLPDILDAKPDTCIPFPDHRLSISISSGDQRNRRRLGEGKNRRTQVFNIPIRPYGVNFSKAYYTTKTPEGEADMFEHERDAFPPAHFHRTKKDSKGWGRAHPHRLFGTVTTGCHMTDARIGGNLMHWDQPRPLSIMEIRRAQGVPDDEVVLGAPADQWKMLGNAVARGISMALGLALREAAMGTLYEDAHV
ncbi:S-adenosyl-L-methionine-dependent methyltransferase, partial [Cryphonectria parasitica EP155]